MGWVKDQAHSLRLLSRFLPAFPTKNQVCLTHSGPKKEVRGPTSVPQKGWAAFFKHELFSQQPLLVHTIKRDFKYM